MKQIQEIDPQEILFKHLTKVEGVTREDIEEANQLDPAVAQAFLDAMNEYSILKIEEYLLTHM